MDSKLGSFTWKVLCVTEELLLLGLGMCLSIIVNDEAMILIATQLFQWLNASCINVIFDWIMLTAKQLAILTKKKLSNGSQHVIFSWY